MSGDPQVHNPVSAEQAIQECPDGIDDSPRVIKEALAAKQEAKKALDVAKAQASLRHVGSDAAKRTAAVVATVTELEDYNRANEAYRYAVEQAKAWRERLSGLQTINGSVRTAYNNAGYRR